MLEAETYQYYQITPILRPGATFGVFSAGSKTTLSCLYLWTELHQTRFPVFLQAIPPESSVGNGKTPLLADWHGFGGFLAVFRLAPRRRCPSLTPGPNCTKLGFLCFCRPFHLNRALETGRHIISRLARFWRFFGVLSAGSKTTLPFAYPWTELHHTWFLGLLQAIPPDSSVRNGKIPVLADYPNFAP